MTSPEEAELLGVPVHSPAFLFERTTQSDARGGGGVRPVRVSRGPVPAGDGASPGPALGLAMDAGRTKAAGEVYVASSAENGRRSNHSTLGWRGEEHEEDQRGGRGVVLAAVVAACGGGDDEPSSEAGAEAGKLEGSISVWIMDPGSPKIQGVVKQYGTDFEAENPGTKVDIQFVPWAQAHDKFVTAIAGGKVPDVAEMGTTWTPEFADQGGLARAAASIGEGEYVSSLVDAATLNEKVYGKPWYAGARSLIYRKDMLEKAGVEPPKTWDELMAAAKAIKAKVKGVYPARLHRALTEHMYLPTIWQAGGEIATQDGDTWKRALNTPAGRGGDRLLRVLLQGGPDPRRPRSAGRSPTRRPRSSTVTSRC